MNNVLRSILFAFLISSSCPFKLQANDLLEESKSQKRPSARQKRSRDNIEITEDAQKRIQQDLSEWMKQKNICLEPGSEIPIDALNSQKNIIRTTIKEACIARGTYKLTADEGNKVLATYIGNKRYKHYFEQWLRDNKLWLDPESELAKLLPDMRKYGIRQVIKEACENRGTNMLTETEEEELLDTFVGTTQFISRFNEWLKDKGLLLDPTVARANRKAIRDKAKEKDQKIPKKDRVSAKMSALEREEALLRLVEEKNGAPGVNNFDNALDTGRSLMTMLEASALRLGTPAFTTVENWLTEDL